MFHHFRNIKNKIFSVAILQLLVFIVLIIFALNFFSTVYEEKVFEESANMLHLSSTLLDEELSKVERLSFLVSTDTLIQNYIRAAAAAETEYELYQRKTLLLERLIAYYEQEKYISSIQIFDAYGETYTAGLNLAHPREDGDMYLDIIEADGRNVWREVESRNSLAAARQIREKANLSLASLGIVVITVNMKDFIEDTLNFSPNKNFVITKNQDIIYSSNFEEEGDINRYFTGEVTDRYEIKQIYDNEYFITSQPSKHSDLTYYNTVAFSDLAEETQFLNQIVIVSFGLLLVFAVVLSRRAAHTISKPLEELTLKMKQVQQGNFTNFEPREKNRYFNDEIEQLHRDFQVMVNKINHLIQENYSKQLIIKETEYKALQAQINPHFLYNTLDSINWLARVNKQHDISIMAESLGSMMRNIIGKKKPLITVEEELEIVKDYITIQRYRYQDRLHFELKVEEGLGRYQIPKLTIQPTVENAIQHSVEEIVSGCSISVDIFSKQDLLTIVITDDGVGMDQKMIQSIYDGTIKSKGSGVGLFNIIERIHIMYGPQYGIDIQSEEQRGTKVMITIPLKRE